MDQKLKLNNAQVYTSKKLIVLLVVTFLLLGLALRFYNLGKSGFWLDELFHVTAADSIIKEGSPIILYEDGEYVEYTRSYPFTYLTLIMFKLFGQSENVARILPVTFNILFIMMGFFFVRKLFSIELAIIFIFIMAFSPLEIYQARECRMYSLFQLLYVSGSFVFFMGFENVNQSGFIGSNNFVKRFSAKNNLNIPLIILGVVLFLFSLKIHVETIGFGISLISYCIFMIAYLYMKKGSRDAILSKYTFVISLGAIVILFIYLYDLEYFFGLLDIGLDVPWFKIRPQKSYHYYISYFINNYPGLSSIYLLSIFFMIINKGRKGLFIFCSFIPLIIFHNFVFGRKGSRYIFYIYPFFVIGSAYIIGEFIPYIKNFLDEKKLNQSKIRQTLLVGFIVVSLNVFTLPWLKDSIKKINYPENLDWKSMTAELKNIPEESVLMTTNIIEILYYSGRKSDFILRAGYGKDIKSNIKDEERLEDIIEKNNLVYFVGDSSNFINNNVVDEKMRLILKNKFVEVPHEGDQRILILKKQ